MGHKLDLPSTSTVKMNVYDVNGKLVGNCMNENLNPRTYSYDFDESNLSSVVYFFKGTYR